jgi:hypothetical protein
MIASVKSAKKITAVAEDYTRALKSRYPKIRAPLLFESLGGSDARLRIEAPPELAEDYLDILRCTSELNFLYEDTRGVRFVTTIVEDESDTMGEAQEGTD